MPERDDVPVAPPDGICLDAEGAVWVADPIGARVFRVREGGEVTDSIAFDDVIPVACVLGGPTGARCSCASPPTGSATRSPVAAPGASTRATSTCPAPAVPDRPRYDASRVEARRAREQVVQRRAAA